MARPLKFTYSMVLRMTPEVRASVQKWATNRGISQAEAIRQLVDQALRK
jgi:hypothetical protein